MDGEQYRRVAIIYFDRARHPLHAVTVEVSVSPDGEAPIISRVKEHWPGVADTARVYSRYPEPVAVFTYADAGARR